MKLLIAIPALNEEQSIRSTIQRCLEAKPEILGHSPVTDVEVTVISDGSTDRTVERAREFGSLINQRFGIFAASAALRHSNITITREAYVDKKERIAIDLSEIMAADRKERQASA